MKKKYWGANCEDMTNRNSHCLQLNQLLLSKSQKVSWNKLKQCQQDIITAQNVLIFLFLKKPKQSAPSIPALYVT